ncbi:MAG: HprK-related kinase B, partial [Thiohalobacterales bacterium]|nr:HprK-related kinase B [Thiohalobacterales bacterium]
GVNEMNTSPEAVAALLQDGAPLCDEALFLAPGGCRMRVRSNSAALIAALGDYFSHVVTAATDPEIDILAIEREAPETGFTFVDWKREPGKTGRKDSYVDLPGGRIVRKVRTGMVFLQSERYRVAAGPCRQYDNQVINFINSQYMNWLQQRGWLICHAAALVCRGRGLAIAGFSGGGKSTLMLHLLDDDGVSYLTNDRLFLRAGPQGTRARGIPKLPRINPGTIVHNRRLQALIPPGEREALLALPPEQLWELEDKYDVHIDRLYGAGRMVDEATLDVLLILNWQRDSTAGVGVERVDLAQRRDLLAAVMKSPGPFYQHTDGHFQRDTDGFDESAYLDTLADVAVYEARGGVDFPALARLSLGGLLT